MKAAKLTRNLWIVCPTSGRSERITAKPTKYKHTSGRVWIRTTAHDHIFDPDREIEVLDR